jgi:uncharacterized protein YndB with AHSA1/START domain
VALGFAGPERTDGPVYDSRLTVTFRDALGGFTALTFVQERLEELFAATPEIADKVSGGWENVLDELAALRL